MRRTAPAYRLLRAVSLLALASTVSASPAVAAPAQVEIPIVLRLVGTSGDTATLDWLVTRPLVADFVAGDPVVSPVETGFQLDVTPTIVAGGRIAAVLDLSVAFLTGPVEKRSIETPEGKRKVQAAELMSYVVNDSFEAADGETVELDPVPAGPPILVTPRILAPVSGTPSMVFIEVAIPFGGHEIQLQELQLVMAPSLVGLLGRQNALRYLTRRTFVSGVVLGEAVTAQVESGSELEVLAGVSGAALGLDLGVRCRTLDGEVPEFPVPTPNGKQKLQLPVLRTLDVETRAEIMDGGTSVVAGVQAGDTEALVFATPRLIEDDGLQSVRVEARVVLAGGDPGKPKGKPVTSDFLKDFDLTAWEGRAMALAETKRRDVVTGYQDVDPVTASLETQARLHFEPTVLGGDDVDLEIALDYGHVDPAVSQRSVKTSKGSRPVDLPTVHRLQLEAGVAVASGGTMVVGGFQQEGVQAARALRDEVLVFLTPTVGAGGDADAVALRAIVVHSSEGEGPMTRSSESLESGPVLGP